MNRFVFILFFNSLVFFASGQDLHMTQWWNSPLFVNPAMNGYQQGEMQFSTGMRSQWKGVSGVPYQTQWLQGELNKWSTHKWSFAGGVARDIAGDGNWRQLQLYANASRHWVIDSASTIISLGGQLKFQQWSWDPNLWQWGSQWNGTYYDSQLPNQEYQLQQTARIVGLNSGVNWQQNWTSLFNSNLALGINQMYASSFDINGSTQRIKPRWNVSMEFNYKLSSNWKARLLSLNQSQLGQKEWIAIGQMENVIDDRVWNYVSWKAGFGFRNRDALVMVFGGQYGQHQLGLSYDWNVSKFAEATEYRGGWELHYSWLLNPLPIPKRVKPVCPDYY